MAASPSVTYPTDLTDREWALLEPLLPPAKSGGRPRSVQLRVILKDLLYVLRCGCQWRLLPRTYGPRSHGLRLLSCVASPRRLGADSRAPVGACAAAERARTDAQRCHHEQSVGQDHGTWRPAWLRRRQKTLRAQAASPRRHARSGPRGARPLGRHPGPYERPVAAASPPAAPAAASAHLGRQRLPGTAAHVGLGDVGLAAPGGRAAGWARAPTARRSGAAPPAARGSTPRRTAGSLSARSRGSTVSAVSRCAMSGALTCIRRSFRSAAR